jgi:hypothetical protein
MVMGGSNYDTFSWKVMKNQGRWFHSWDLKTFSASD